MFFGFLSFIIGSFSGIARGGGLELGFIDKLSFFHQYFMIGGFFGTLIMAERIVSLRNEKLNFSHPRKYFGNSVYNSQSKNLPDIFLFRGFNTLCSIFVFPFEVQERRIFNFGFIGYFLYTWF